MPSLAHLLYLRKLKLCYCNIVEVPDSIGGLSCLKYLYLDGNNFTSLPGSLSQLYHLHKLQLFGCKKLEMLPELPPNLNILFAPYCTSLYQHPPSDFNIQSSFAMFFKGCPKSFRNVSIESAVCMCQPPLDLNSSITSHSCRNQISFLQFMEFPSNIREIFGGQDIYHLDIKYHGNRIPQWFTDTRMGNHFQYDLPPNFCYNKLRGFGFCVVLTLKKYFHDHFKYNNIPNYHVDNFDGTSLVDHYPFVYPSTEISKSNIIWFCFQSWISSGWHEAKNFVTFSFEHGDDVEVKECGFRLVFDEDIEEKTNFSLIQELPTPTQKGGAIEMWRNNRRFYLSS
ncbi:Leucine-rich repeat-containing protein [Cynara cardunculus var. scolymus]|uniref:Leucine-rich repeat-containing protein n=2 Tax=Cynara cardunculus var. scolymus TaxID=59895 RepID=A0A103UCV4_CYNCS|nr:Leucine-rich repeat-containing protein [Cynara cardunculus var. scolymus]